jgi:Tol biopolymer transport system component/DNA-binding winged helix-turn-helix (wHTH) protein
MFRVGGASVNPVALFSTPKSNQKISSSFRMRSEPASENLESCDTLALLMPDATQAPAVRRFGAFEINPQLGELRKNGMRLRLSGQPFQVLAVLVERSGEVVTREELRPKLWPADTFVDFDHGLNNAVARIREVLEDSSEAPRYIETIPRRGYRFIASLTDVAPARKPLAPESALAGTEVPPGHVSGLSGGPIARLVSMRSPHPWSRLVLSALALGIVLAPFLLWVLRTKFAKPVAIAPPEARVIRLTNIAGLEESPAISPDGKSLAFTGGVDGKRQVLVRLITGGTNLQITHDPVDHQCPRWLPDSSSILYFSPTISGAVQGSIFEISALGGAPRRVASSVGCADVSPANGRLALFRLSNQGIQLVTASADASRFDVVSEFAPNAYYLYPRWSPDGKWIAFQRGDTIRFDIFVAPATGGKPRQLTRDNTMMSGFAWLPDSTGIIYSSSRDSTMPYSPTLGLWQATLRDGSVRRIISGETSYASPDVSKRGTILVSRMRLQTDIWRFPVDGQPSDNVGRGVRITRQTGQVLTPTASPDDKEIAFLSDSGGHANLWITDLESGALRQITNELDPSVAVGVPVWSPVGRTIAFVSSRGNQGLTFGVWLVDSDGSNLRNAANPGLGPAWSSDGRWIYYSTWSGAAPTDVVLKKVPADGGMPVTVRTERLRDASGLHDTRLYYTVERPLVDGTPEFEIRTANPEDGKSSVLARIPASRVPIGQIVHPALSPDGKWLAQALTDGFTTNLWAISTRTGKWRQITDFGERTTFIARSVSWSSDGRHIFAAVADGDSDIVLLEGLTNIGATERIEK